MPSQTPPPEPSDSKRGGTRGRGRALREAGPYIGLGTTLAATVLAGLGAGYWLDSRLGTSPWLLLVGGTLGLGAALIHFVRLASNLSKRLGRKR